MTASGHQACLLLGSNIQPEYNLPHAIDQLRDQITILRISSVWETPAVGSPGPDFLNAALLAETPLDEKTLKSQVLLPLEARMGRVRSADKNAPRTIDLDLVIFDSRLLDATLWRFAHRAVPVAQVVPEFVSAGGETLQEVADKLARTDTIRPRPDISMPPLRPSA